MIRRRWKYLLALVLVMAAIPGVSLAASRSSSQSPDTGGLLKVPFISHAHSTSVAVIDRSCAAPPPGVTQVGVRVASAWGDHAADTVRGSNVTEACLSIATDGSMTAYGEATFTGTVKGCGSGTMRFTVVGQIGAPDPTTGVRLSADQALFVQRSGTGGFERVVAGRFTLTGRAAPDLSLTGTVDGVLSCESF